MQYLILEINVYRGILIYLFFFFFLLFIISFFPPTAAINTRGENKWDRRVALKKHVWIQDCEELAAESNDENSPAWGQY